MAMTNIGSRLRSAREQRNLSLADVCRVTKVPVATLDAIERGDTARLSPSIFGRGFVRAFAIQVSLDPEQAVADYVAQFRVEPPAAPSEPVRKAPSGDGRNVAVLAAVVAVAFAFAIYSTWSRARTESAFPPPQASVAVKPRAIDAHPISTVAAVTPTMGLQIESRGRCVVAATADGQSVVSRRLVAGERVSLQGRDEISVGLTNPDDCIYQIDSTPNMRTERDRRGNTLTIRLVDASNEGSPASAPQASVISATELPPARAQVRRAVRPAVAPANRTGDSAAHAPLLAPATDQEERRATTDEPSATAPEPTSREDSPASSAPLNPPPPQ